MRELSEFERKWESKLVVREKKRNFKLTRKKLKFTKNVANSICVNSTASILLSHNFPKIKRP